MVDAVACAEVTPRRAQLARAGADWPKRRRPTGPLAPDGAVAGECIAVAQLFKSHFGFPYARGAAPRRPRFDLLRANGHAVLPNASAKVCRAASLRPGRLPSGGPAPLAGHVSRAAQIDPAPFHFCVY